MSTVQNIEEGMWLAESGRDGPAVCLSTAVHGNERAPIAAGEELLRRLTAGTLAPESGRLLLLLANPPAAAQNQRWSEGGVDLNRCFSNEILAREPELYEEHRARSLADRLESLGIEILVDFHCTVEPGQRFLIHHPPAADSAHASVARWLAAEVLLADPSLQFGGVSMDEWMSTRGRVGICYETGWIGDPANTPEDVLDDMLNVLRGIGSLGDRQPEERGEKTLLELGAPLLCESEGFRWADGVGENLQDLAAGSRLGGYEGGADVRLEQAATLVFPKKRPELVTLGKPLVFLARRAD